MGAKSALQEAAAHGVERTAEVLHYRKDGTAFCDQARPNLTPCTLCFAKCSPSVNSHMVCYLACWPPPSGKA